MAIFLQIHLKPLVSLILFCFLLSPIYAQICDESATTSDGHQIIFNGVTYNNNGSTCTSTWTYCLIAGPNDPEISHFMIGNASCFECFNSTNDIVEASHPFEMGTDPTTGYCGIKFDFGLAVNEELCFSFTLNGAFEISESVFAVKAANNFTTIEICGPSCTSTSCSNEPAPEPDCTDILATRQVENTFDNCGEWCDGSYVFTLGQDNCYVAGNDLLFTEYTNGTALLSGSVIQNGEIGQLSVTFTGRTNTTPIGSPKYGLCINDGGDFWYYYTQFTGTFTFPDGSVINMTRKGPAFQIGYGGNLQEGEFGGAAWFYYNNESASGDLNFQLSSPIECIEDGIALESECADVGNLFETHTNTNASNGDYLTVQQGNNAYSEAPTNENDRVRFTVNASKSGPYNIFARVMAPSTSDDSFWVRANNGNWIKWNNIEPSSNFIWDQVHDSDNSDLLISFFLEAGTNTIDFAYREDGVKLDKVYISSEETIPTGLGIDAQNCNCYGYVDINCIALNDICNGTSSLGINLEVSGSSENFDFQWSNGANTQNLSNIGPGTYVVTVTGDDGCSATCETTLEVYEAFSIQCEATSATCNNNGGTNSDGTVTVTVSGGTGPYTYHWSNNACTDYEENLEEGTYTITVTDANGCEQICNVDVESELPINLYCQVLNDYCEGNQNATIYLETSVDLNYLTYLWSTGATTPTLSNVGPGDYSVTVTSIFSGCTKSCEATIDQIEPLSILCEGTNTGCGDEDNGTITVTATGGTGPYIYHWSDNTCTNYASGLSEGTYTITVTDANGCEEVCSVEIFSESTIIASCLAENNNCLGNDNGTITTQVTGGTGNYTYLWNNGNTTSSLEDIEAGNYSVTITDQNGCSAICETTIEQIDPLNLLCEATNSSCDQNINNISSSITGGSGNYTFLWSNGATSQNIENIASGTYSLTVTDENGCTASCESTIIAYNPISISCSTQNANCDQAFGSISSNVSGGTGNYTFLWSNGATSQNIEDLSAGIYSLTVTDESGCTASCESTIIDYNPISISCTAQNANCDQTLSSISSNVSGGTGNYTFLWSNGATSQNIEDLSAGTYSLTVTDGNGCTASCESTIIDYNPISISCTAQNANCDQILGSISSNVSGGTGNYTFLWSNGATSQNIENIASGTYSLTVTDENGCDAICETSISNMNAIIANCEATDLACGEPNTGMVSLTVSGGMAPYSFLWSNGATTQELNDIDAGEYALTITDANGCTSVCETIVNTPEPIFVISNSIPLACNGDSTSSADFIIEGGTPPYTYIWDTGSTDPVINNLGSGFYGITVTDANGCIGICGTWVESPEAIEVNFEQTPVSCFGGNNGSITTSVTGGTGTYTFAWSNGAATPHLNSLETGDYTLTISDENGCTNIFTTTIESNAEIIGICTSTPLSCHQNNSGSVQLNITGGTGSYTYLWNNGATTQHIDNLDSGDYSVTITDTNGCTAICSSTVDAPLALAINCNASDLVCAQASTGAIDLSIEGGTAPYTFQWNTGAITQNISNLDEGTYQVTVTDANDCSAICSASIESAIALTANCTGQNLFCGEVNSGAINVELSGGTAPFTYLWNNGATTQNLSNLSAGNYEITITDANGCNTICSSTIIEVEALTISCTGQDLLCGDPNSGNIDLTINGGTAPYSFLWSDGSNTQNLTDINEGTYFVTVTDANGCVEICETSISYFAPMSALCTPQNLECGAAQTGSIDLEITGGTAPFTFLWDNGQTTEDLNNLNAGTYEVTITDTNGCTTICTSTIASDPAFEIMCIADGVTCGNSNSGNITLEIIGGHEPYSYLWSDGTVSNQLLNVPSGNYSVTVTDANGCIASCSSTVEVSLGLNLESIPVGTQCGEANTGSIDLTVSGGTGNYTYTWNNGATTEDLMALDPGNYSVTVSDSNGCTGISNTTVEESTELEAVCESEEIPCGGQADGSVDVTVTGGSGDYTYEWSNGEITEDITGVTAGTYEVTVTDANGCTTTCSNTVTEGAALQVSCQKTNISCKNANDGSIDVTVVGGIEPYTYTWSNGANTEDLQDLSKAVYTITVTDANGCSSTCSSSITEPATLLVIPNGNNITCNGANNGTAFATVIGGTVPYTYEWSNGQTVSFINTLSAGSYTLTVTDANGCQNFGAVVITEPEQLTTSCTAINENCQPSSGAIDLNITGGTAPYTYLWNNGQTTEDLFNVTAGDYMVTVTDANGCSSICSSTIASGNPIELSSIATAASCGMPSVGSIDLTVLGGTGPYFYQWSNGNSTEDNLNIESGSYSVTVTDVFGCSNTHTSIVEAAPSLSLQLVSENVTCNGAATGSISLTVGQGFPPFTYQWSNGASTEYITDLTAGAYSVTVTDANGCQGFETATISQPSSILVVCSSTPIACNGGVGGTAFATAIGGTSPFQYTWSNGMNTPFINTLSAGTYSVTVTDANGCTAISSTTIEAPAPIDIVFTNNQLICQEDNNGSIQTSISGGQAPYSYQWSNGANTANIDNLSAGTYTVIITDNNGCTNTGSTIIEANNPMTITCLAEDVLCTGESNGQVSVEIIGGVEPYLFEWSNGSTSTLIEDIPAGEYIVTVTDANGCSTTCSSIVNEPEQLIAIYGTTDITCHGDLDGTLYAVGQGGVEPYTFEWSTGDSTETVEGLPSGAYGLTLTDANGCIFICGLIINEPEAITCSNDVVSAASGNPDLFDLSISASGGVGTYLYSIDDGSTFQSSATFTDLFAGTYTVIISDENGCTSDCGPIEVGISGLSSNEKSIKELSPNPASDNVVVAYKTQSEAYVTFEVKTMTGEVLYQKGLQTQKGDNAISINTETYTSGHYILTLYTDQGIESTQFIVLKRNQ